MRLRVQSLTLLSGLRIWRCRELSYRSQMRLESCVAVVRVSAGGYSSDWTPSLETSICRGNGSRKGKKTKKKKKVYSPLILSRSLPINQLCSQKYEIKSGSPSKECTERTSTAGSDFKSQAGSGTMISSHGPRDQKPDSLPSAH